MWRRSRTGRAAQSGAAVTDNTFHGPGAAQARGVQVNLFGGAPEGPGFTAESSSLRPRASSWIRCGAARSSSPDSPS